jgi:hypothetical protein
VDVQETVLSHGKYGHGGERKKCWPLSVTKFLSLGLGFAKGAERKHAKFQANF